MAKRIPGWVLGCGIGCGVIVLLVAVLIGTGAWWVRDTMKGFDTAVKTRATLEERFGDAASFTPEPDGVVPPARIEAFLAVREATQPAREAIVRIFDALPMSEEEASALKAKPMLEKFTSIFSIGSTALGMPARLGEFFESRNRALLDRGMGMGEYTYIYVVAYYGVLGRAPDEGPQSDRIRIDLEEEGPVRRRENMMDLQLARRIHDEVLSMLRNQRAALAERTDLPGASELDAALAAEIAAMEEEPRRLPWPDGPPAAVAAAIVPYRERLLTHWSPLTNPFELARNRRRGRFSVDAD